MPRPRSPSVALVKEKLLARLGDGLHRPGDRFMSGRAIAAQFSISYQTADRLLRELVSDGVLERRAASGTYVAGRGRASAGVQLVFDRRGRRAGSFGARLLGAVRDRLRRDGVDSTVTWSDRTTAAPLSAGRYPVLWEAPATAAALARRLAGGLILNDRPPAGLGALLIDSIGVDDFLGGACAADIVARRLGRGRARVAVLAGPREDARSAQRVAGFLSVLPTATVTHAPSWFREDATPAAVAVLKAQPQAVFACNDRLAEAVLTADRDTPSPTPVVLGFDDAPVAEALHLSSIAIPWDDLAKAVSTTLTRRLAGDTSTASRLVLAPKPVLRLT